MPNFIKTIKYILYTIKFSLNKCPAQTTLQSLRTIYCNLNTNKKMLIFLRLSTVF